MSLRDRADIKTWLLAISARALSGRPPDASVPVERVIGISWITVEPDVHNDNRAARSAAWLTYKPRQRLGKHDFRGRAVILASQAVDFGYASGHFHRRFIVGLSLER